MPEYGAKRTQMQFNISISHLTVLLRDAAEEGATIALVKCGKIKPFMSKSEAYKTYSRKNVDRWIQEGLVTDHQDGEGANYRIDRIEIETVAKASNRHTYLKTNQRA